MKRRLEISLRVHQPGYGHTNDPDWWVCREIDFMGNVPSFFPAVVAMGWIRVTRWSRMADEIKKNLRT